MKDWKCGAIGILGVAVAVGAIVAIHESKKMKDVCKQFEGMMQRVGNHNHANILNDLGGVVKCKEVQKP